MGSNFGLCPEEPEKKKLPYLITCIEEKFTCIGAWENRWKIWQMTVKPLLQKITACLDRGTLKPNTDVGHEWFYGQVFTCQVFCPIIVCISPDPQMYSLRQKKKKGIKKGSFCSNPHSCSNLPHLPHPQTYYSLMILDKDLPHLWVSISSSVKWGQQLFHKLCT